MPEQTLQPGSEGIDTHIAGTAPTTNYETADPLIVGHGSDTNTDLLLKFDLSSIAPGSQIQKATLSLYLSGLFAGNGAGDCTLSRIKSANSGWSESGATWNTIDGATAWAGSAGCNTSGTDYDVDPLWSGTPSVTTGAFDDFEIDNLTVFQKMLDIGNYGMKLWAQARNPATTGNYQYAASDNGTAANRPKLFIRWLEPAGRLVEYTFNIWDPEKKVIDSKGAVVQPNEVRPDNWIRVEGFELPRGKAYSSLVPDPTTSYIVGANYDVERESVRLITDRNQFAELIVRRIAGGA